MAQGHSASEAAAAQTTRAILAMLAGAFLLTLNDGLIKSLAATYPAGEVMFVRGLFVLPWVFVLARRDGGLRLLRVNNIKAQGVRGLCVIASSFLFINGLVFLPLADAIAAAFTGPLFITAMAPLVLGEPVGWRRWLAVLAGFAGVLVMLRPGGGTLQWAILLPLGAALCGGTRDLITRRIAQTESSVALLLVTTASAMFAGLATSLLGWPDFQVEDLPTFALSGFLVAGAHYLMIEAFRHGEAALVAPFKYSSMVWAVLFGFLLFGELPDIWTLAGSAIVIFAGLYILRRETQLRRRPVTAVGPSARL